MPQTPDHNQPVIIFIIWYFGTAEQAQPWITPFVNIGPISASTSTAPYKDMAHLSLGAGVGDPLCLGGGTTKAFFNVGIKSYNVAANRQVYNLFTKMVTDSPALNASFVQFEAYALQGLKAVDPASSAYAHRDDNILVSFSTEYKPSAENDALAAKYGKQARQIWLDAQPERRYNSYPNYAYGDASDDGCLFFGLRGQIHFQRMS